jgi:hypothetical protein
MSLLDPSFEARRMKVMAIITMQFCYYVCVLIIHQANNALAFVFEQLRIVLCSRKRGQNHGDLGLTNTSILESILFCLLANHHVEARYSASYH